MSYNLHIQEFNRITFDGEVETLNLEKGINLLYGEPNTGKTFWLQLLDFLLGDRGTPEDAFSDDESLLQKYTAVTATININSSTHVIGIHAGKYILHELIRRMIFAVKNEITLTQGTPNVRPNVSYTGQIR